MSDVNPTSLTCPFCDTLVVDKSALHCEKSSRLFSCHTCVHERFKNDFPKLHTEIEGIIKEKNDSLLAFIMTNSPPANLSSTPIITTLPTSIIATSPHLDISRSQISSPTSVVLTTNPPYVVLTTNPPLVRVPNPSTSDFIGTHTASNSNRVTSVATSTDPPSAALPQINPSPIKPPCHFYMQGSCKHGKRGSDCLFHQPPICFKFIGKGSKGCDLYAYIPTPNYVTHLSPTADAIEKYAVSTMYQVPSDSTILAHHLKNIPTTN